MIGFFAALGLQAVATVLSPLRSGAEAHGASRRLTSGASEAQLKGPPCAIVLSGAPRRMNELLERISARPGVQDALLVGAAVAAKKGLSLEDDIPGRGNTILLLAGNEARMTILLKDIRPLAGVREAIRAGLPHAQKFGFAPATVAHAA